MEKRTKVDIKGITAIDVHSHYDYGNEHDRGEDEAHCTQLEYVKRMYDSANIGTAFCSTFASILSSEAVCEGNEYNFELAQKLEWMYQWVVVDPRIYESFAQAKRMLKNKKCVGIKIHPHNHKYSLSEFGDRIFSFAADQNAIILQHPEADISSVLALADKYPDNILIFAYLGSVEHVNMVEHSKPGNIYLDTSGAASSRNKIIEYAVERIGSERILFGTDTYSSGFQRGRIEYALISDEEKMNILRNNAVKLFAKNIL